MYWALAVFVSNLMAILLGAILLGWAGLLGLQSPIEGVAD